MLKPRLEIHVAKSAGRPEKVIALVKKAAPIKINAIMQDVLVAPYRLSWNDFMVNEPETPAITKAPNTPNAAASVAVAAQKCRRIAVRNTMGRGASFRSAVILRNAFMLGLL